MSQFSPPQEPNYGSGGPQPYGQPYAQQPNPQPYGQGAYASQPYGQQAPPAQPAPYPSHSPYGPRSYLPPEHPQGTTILVLGIVGFVVFPCGIVAWYMGNKALKELRASGIQYSNESNINIGKILGMVTSIIGIVAVGLVLVQIIVSVVIYVAAFASLAAY